MLKYLDAADGRLAMGRIGAGMDFEKRLEERRRLRAIEDAIIASLMRKERTWCFGVCDGSFFFLFFAASCVLGRKLAEGEGF